MKILMLLSNPFMVDPRVHNEAKALVDEGNKVAVVVWDRRGEYGQEGLIDGVRIVRIHNTGLMKVMPNDLFRNPIWWRTTYKKDWNYGEMALISMLPIAMNCKDLVYNEYAPPDNDMFTPSYIGLMAKGRFSPRIMNLLNGIEGVRLTIGGRKEGIYSEVERICEKYQDVEFVGTIPSSEILPRTHIADAIFILVDPNNSNNRTTVFNKQFEAMVCGRPIMVTKDTYAGRMTEELDCGLTIAYNANSIRKAIEELRDNPPLCEKLGRNAFSAAKKRYNWEMEKKNLLKVYEKVK